MRIRIGVSGIPEYWFGVAEVINGGGFDTPETIRYATHVASILNQALQRIKDSGLAGKYEDAKKRSAENALKRGSIGFVYVDVYMQRVKGKPQFFAKISTAENADTGVRTVNALPICARFVWTLLRSTSKTIRDTSKQEHGKHAKKYTPFTIIKDFCDPKDSTHDAIWNDTTGIYEDVPRKNMAI